MNLPGLTPASRQNVTEALRSLEPYCAGWRSLEALARPIWCGLGAADGMRNALTQAGGEMVPSTHAVRLVIIDDEPNSLAYLATALDSYGAEIFVSADPRQGLELVQTHRPQIVVTDLVMPNVSGLDVLRRVKELNPATRVVVMTASPCAATFAEAMRCGASDYLAKPIPLAVLREGVGELIKHAMHESESSG